MGEKPVKLGSLTLLLTVVLLCLAILAVLTLSTARADLSLAQKHADRVQQAYAMDTQGQQLLAAVDKALQAGAQQEALAALLPQDAVLEENIVTLSLADNAGRMLTIALKLTPEGAEVLQWRPSVEWSPEELLEGLWGAE